MPAILDNEFQLTRRYPLCPVTLRFCGNGPSLLSEAEKVRVFEELWYRAGIDFRAPRFDRHGTAFLPRDAPCDVARVIELLEAGRTVVVKLAEFTAITLAPHRDQGGERWTVAELADLVTTAAVLDHLDHSVAAQILELLPELTRPRSGPGLPHPAVELPLRGIA